MSRSSGVAEHVEARARASLGSSHDGIYRMIADALHQRGIRGGHVVDVGCGRGELWATLGASFSSYCGLDAVRYEEFPADLDLRIADLDSPVWPIDAGVADLVVSAETIEHLENPWAFMRGVVRIARPGGWIIVTTPNQLSGLSLLTLLLKRHFVQFQDGQYPAHRTALLESDLCRMAAESSLEDVALDYSRRGRIPLTARYVPSAVAGMSPRRFSDNLMIIGRKPREASRSA